MGNIENISSIHLLLKDEKYTKQEVMKKGKGINLYTS